MTLNCSADNCVYSNSGICYAGSIKVNGVDASTTTGTTCATYTPKNNENSLSNNSSNTFTTSTDIDCKARKCNYNSDGTCTAASVQINHNNASCDTFICF